MRTDVTPGQTSDDRGFDSSWTMPCPRRANCLPTRATTRTASATGPRPRPRPAIPVIPMRRNRKARAGVDKTLYALRNPVERCVRRLKNSRRVATRYDKTVESVLGFVDIACIRLWTQRSVNRTWVSVTSFLEEVSANSLPEDDLGDLGAG
ncbi:Transposase [Jannaschia seosinensis]|uniref:Transposase n=1 Tax=Jannaschia seosinensis TaxID=313367 RepID=A0A0M7B4Y2_9RHOB|nr:Transposase [Jannaschia seosinensis]